jgi:hypothetical protein
MPKKVTFVSSISGTEVDESEAFKIRITGKGKMHEADCTESEATALIKEVKAVEGKPRGRKPKAA